MFLFARLATMQGTPRDTIGWCTRMTEFVNANSELNATLWGGVFGYPVGTVAWSAAVEGRAQLAEGMDALMMNDGYHDLIAEAQQFVSGIPPQDHLREMVHGELGDEPPGIGDYVGVITATPANGRMLDVMAWGPEIATTYQSVTGASTAFFTDAYGTFGQVTWMIRYGDAEAVDAAEAAANADQDYLGEVAKSGDLFVAGSGHTSLVRRIT